MITRARALGLVALGGVLASCGGGAPLKPQGAAGSTASAGTTGAAGTDGVAGTTGAAGTPGVAGTTGAAGTTGVAGATGAAGSAVFVVPCPVGVQGHCNSETGATDKYPGYTLALAEEFDTPLDLDNDPIWTWSDGSEFSGQTRYQKEGITFADGKMIITASAKKVPDGFSYADQYKDQIPGHVPALTVVSGELRTKYNNYRYGRYEARFKAPVETRDKNSFGNFISTLFIHRTPKWQDRWFEVGVSLEAHLKGRVDSRLFNIDPARDFPNEESFGTAPSAGFSIQEPHTHAFEWTPTKVAWYIDGVWQRDNLGRLPVPQSSSKIMMSLWVFANSAAYGIVENNVYPFSSEYEWFRFYKWNAETTYPYGNPKTQLPAGDVDFSQNNPNEAVYP